MVHHERMIFRHTRWYLDFALLRLFDAPHSVARRTAILRSNRLPTSIAVGTHSHGLNVNIGVTIGVPDLSFAFADMALCFCRAWLESRCRAGAARF